MNIIQHKHNDLLTMKDNFTILLADDHSILRAGLRSILNSIPEFEVIAEANNGKDALKIAKKDYLALNVWS